MERYVLKCTFHPNEKKTYEYLTPQGTNIDTIDSWTHAVVDTASGYAVVSIKSYTTYLESDYDGPLKTIVHGFSHIPHQERLEAKRRLDSLMSKLEDMAAQKSREAALRSVLGDSAADIFAEIDRLKNTI